MSLLGAVADRWKEIAEGLGFVEHHIDEIDDNNDVDTSRLQDCVEQWVSRLDPTWEKLARVLSDMGLEDLAQQALKIDGELE